MLLKYKNPYIAIILGLIFSFFTIGSRSHRKDLGLYGILATPLALMTIGAF